MSLFSKLFGTSQTEKVHWKDVEYDVGYSQVTVNMKDGRVFLVTRIGRMSEGIHFGRPLIWRAKDALEHHLDKCKGLLCVDGGYRVATCDITQISPIHTVPYLMSFRDMELNDA